MNAGMNAVVVLQYVCRHTTVSPQAPHTRAQLTAHTQFSCEKVEKSISGVVTTKVLNINKVKGHACSMLAACTSLVILQVLAEAATSAWSLKR